MIYKEGTPVIYKDRALTFEAGKIFYPDVKTKTGQKAIMMDWEAPIMNASAQYVAENGGRILEIGFGLGISAGYIQSYSPESHVIVEIHPEIASQARTWGKQGSGVKVLEGDWYDLTKEIEANGPYDGIFYDAFGDINIKYLVNFCASIINKGGRFTLWNPLPYPFGKENQRLPDASVTYEVIDLKEANIPENDYFEFDQYYLPKIQF
jgi:protein arginine N-methyltransferase 2